MLLHVLCSPNQVSGQTSGCKFLRTICLLINNESSHVLFDTCSDLLVNQSRVSNSFFFSSMQYYCWKMSQQEARHGFFLARGTSRESGHSKNSFVTSYSFTLSPHWRGGVGSKWSPTTIAVYWSSLITSIRLCQTKSWERKIAEKVLQFSNV